MNQVKIVYYKSAKAYYRVESNIHLDVATLTKYTGNNAHKPPRKVTYIKDRSFTSFNLQHSASLLEDVIRATAKR